MNRSILMFALVFVGLTADAQVIRPRGWTTTPAIAPTAATKATPEAKPATPTTTTTGSLVIGGAFPATAEATREFEVPLAIKGGTGPYELAANLGNIEGDFFYWKPTKEGEQEVTLKVTDSSTPTKLTGERKVSIVVTPRVTTLRDLDEHLAIVAKAGDLRLMSRELTETWKSNTEATRQGTYRVDKNYAQLHRDLKYVVWGLGVLAVLVVLGFGLLYKKIRKVVIGVLIGALCLGMGTTQMEAAPPTTTPTCTIRSVSQNVVVKEQDPVAITIATRNCKDVKSIAVRDAEVVFTEFVATKTGVTVKVSANAAALTGPTNFKLVLGDGSEALSPDSVSLLVLDTQTAMIRRDATAATATASKGIEVIKAKIAELEAKSTANATESAVTATAVKELSSSRPTKAETTEIVLNTIEALAKRVAELEKQPLAGKVGALEDSVNRHSEQIGTLIANTAELAGGQAELAKTVIKKGGILGFGGKKPLNPEVAAAAERIRRAVLAASN